MAITIRQSTNSALQYNNAGLTEYLIADNLTDKKFLTNAPGLRILNQNERSVLDFLVNDLSFVGGLLKQYKDKNGVILYETILNLSNSNINVHNSIGVDWNDEDIPTGTTTQCLTIIANGNEITNGDFELGSGNTFTDWTKELSSATNELLYSEQIKQFPTWNFYGVTLSANNTTAPNGTTTADLVTEDAGFSMEYYVYQNVDLGGLVTATFSFYVKPNGRDIIYLQFYDTAAVATNTWFDIATGQVLTNQNDSATIDDAGNGWFRCSITRSAVDLSGLGSAVTGGLADADNSITYIGDGTSGAWFWGGQLEVGDVMTSYKATTNTAVTEDEGSVVQATRTNLLLRSQEFDNASWDKININISANSTTAPDGTMTADKIVSSNVNDEHLLSTTYTANGKQLTLSIYVKKLDYRYFILRSINDTDTYQINTFDLNNKIFTRTDLGTSKFEELENGWFRISVTFNTLANKFLAVQYGNSNIDNIFAFNYLGDGVSGNYLWGAQLEQSPYASAYIPTTTTAVTVADGRNGTRAPRFNRESLEVALYQVCTTIGVEYRLQFWAKYYEGFPELSITDGTTSYGSFAITSEDYELHELTFTATGTGFYIEITSGDYSGVAIDDITLRENNFIGLTETKCFKLDSNCYEHENQIQWVNKLGGKDTFMFTGLPIKEKAIQRQNEIKYPVANNFQAPSAIYQSRSISSRESMTIFTRCENEGTARWLRDEINDCIAIYLLVGSEYYPIIPETANVQVFNENGFNYQVNMKFKFAFDVNIQTI